MKNFIKITFLLAFVVVQVYAQNPAPANKQNKPTAIVNARIVVGNGSIIEKGTLAFKNGIIEQVGDNITLGSEYKIIDANGKSIYPGLISPNSQVGLNEIAAVRTTQDYNEIGDYNPNVRALVAYNTDSEVIPTVRSNGVLVAQVTPEGGVIAGTSSVVYNDGWNWEDAVVKVDEGIWMNWPNLVERSFNRETFTVEEKKNEKYDQLLKEIENLFVDAKAYGDVKIAENANLKLKALEGLFNGNKTLYINASNGKQLVEAIKLTEKVGIQKIVFVGVENAELAYGLLKQKNIPVIVNSTHRMPSREDYGVWSAYELPKKLVDAGILVGMYYNDSYWRSRNLGFVAGNAAAHGLSKTDALKMITINNAKILGIDSILGSLEIGKHATFLITDGDILDMKSANVLNAYIKGGEVDLDDKQKRLYQKYKTKYGLD